MYIIDYNHETLFYVNDTHKTYNKFYSKTRIYFDYKSNVVGISVI